MPEEIACRLIRTTAELEAFAPQWSALWREDPHATPFQSPEWLLPWWHQFRQPDLRAVAICRGGALIGFLPFYVYREPHTGERQLLLLGVGTTDYLDGVFASACTVEHVEKALDTLCAEEGWDVLYASQLLPGSPLLLALESHFETAGEYSLRRFAGESCSRMPAVPIAELPPKIRHNVTYYRNRALRSGTLEFTVVDEASWAEVFDALRSLHAARWASRGETGVLDDERVLAWHREALPLLEQSGLLRLCSLRLNGEMAAVLYSLIDPPSRPLRTQYVYLTAFSMGHAQFGPGTLLLALATERAASEGVRTIDMLRGDEGYKQLWHMELMPTLGLSLHRGAQPLEAFSPAGAARLSPAE